MLQPKKKTVKPVKPAKTVEKYIPTARQKKNIEDAKKNINMVPPFKSGGSMKKAKSGFAALAPPFDKATFADKIAGAKRNAGKAKSGTNMKKAQTGTVSKPSPYPTSGVGNSNMPAKSGTKMKKAFLGTILGGVGKSMLGGMGKEMLGGLAGKALGGLMGKNGKSVKKAQNGNNVVPRNLNKRQLERVQRINETSRDRANRVANRISDRRNARGAENLRMNGDAQFNMKSGGKMKKCKYGCK